MLSRIGRKSRAWAQVDPWTNVYGTARSLVALGTLLTLLFNSTDALFLRGLRPGEAPACFGAARAALFCWVPGEYLEAARWGAVGILLVVASGWRPRITGVLHWWVSFSLHTTAILLDGGDQVAVVITLFLLPVTLTDRRAWHWKRSESPDQPEGEEKRRLVALSALVALRLQVAGIYFHAAIAKFDVTEWTDGTAVYYWFTDPLFGASPWLLNLLMPALRNPVGVLVMTWGALVLEIFLFTGLVMEKRHRKHLLWLGFGFHAAIGLVHGIISFALSMWAALILFLRPVDEEFELIRRVGFSVLRLRSNQLHAPPGPQPVQ